MPLQQSARWVKDSTGLWRRGRGTRSPRPSVFGVEVPVPGVNCGLINESILTAYNSVDAGSFTIPDGTDLSNKIVYGVPKPPDPMNIGIIGSNVLFRGPSNASIAANFSSTNVGCFHSRTGVGGTGFVQITDFEMRPQANDQHVNGLFGAYRCRFDRGYIHGCKDALDTMQPNTGTDTKVNGWLRGSYLTDFLYMRPDFEHAPGGSHCDCWQHHSGTDFLFEGNYGNGVFVLADGSLNVEDGRTAGDMGGSGWVFNNLGTTPANETVIARKNWMKGFSAMAYIWPGITLTVEQNKFSKTTFNNYWIRIYAGASPINGIDKVGNAHGGGTWWDGPTAGAELSGTPDRYGGINYMP